MSPIAVNLAAVRARIDAAARDAGRDPAGIRLIAVSKTHSAAAIRDCIEAGQRDFGENYLQEALAKMDALARESITWHYIGRIQSNKTRELAARFDWVQTVDRERIARRLSEHRPAGLPLLDVCLQVNIDREPQKAGVLPEDVAALARLVADLPRLRLRGLMAIPRAEPAESARDAFMRLREIFETLRGEGLPIDTLSMGMSGDLDAAVAAGSTMVRIGTAIFGERG